MHIITDTIASVYRAKVHFHDRFLSLEDQPSSQRVFDQYTSCTNNVVVRRKLQNNKQCYTMFKVIVGISLKTTLCINTEPVFISIPIQALTDPLHIIQCIHGDECTLIVLPIFWFSKLYVYNIHPLVGILPK